MIHNFNSFKKLNEGVVHTASKLPFPGAVVTKVVYDGEGANIYFDGKETSSVYAFTTDYRVMLDEHGLLEQWEALKEEFKDTFLIDGQESSAYILLCFEQGKDPYFLPRVRTGSSLSYHTMSLDELRSKIER